MFVLLTCRELSFWLVVWRTSGLWTPEALHNKAFVFCRFRLLGVVYLRRFDLAFEAPEFFYFSVLRRQPGAADSRTDRYLLLVPRAAEQAVPAMVQGMRRDGLQRGGAPRRYDHRSRMS